LGKIQLKILNLGCDHPQTDGMDNITADVQKADSRIKKASFSGKFIPAKLP
jgi:hypothetical protein